MHVPSNIPKLETKLASLRPRRDVPLAPYTTFRIGGPADLFCEPSSASELALAVLAARELEVPYFVLGLGANILIGDKGFRGLVIRNAAHHERWGDDGKLWVESGAIMRDLITEAVHRGWSGLEHFVGIPSTVGGAIWQNLHFLSPGAGARAHGVHRRGVRLVRDPERRGRAEDRRCRVRQLRLRRHHFPSPRRHRARSDVRTEARRSAIRCIA